MLVRIARNAKILVVAGNLPVRKRSLRRGRLHIECGQHTEQKDKKEAVTHE
jgi:hypothetical protein